MRGFLPAGRGISVALDLSPEQLKITSFMALLVKLELHRQQHPNRNWIFAAARRLKEPFLDRIHGCGIEIAKAGGLFNEHVADPAVLEHAHAERGHALQACPARRLRIARLDLIAADRPCGVGQGFA